MRHADPQAKHTARGHGRPSVNCVRPRSDVGDQPRTSDFSLGAQSYVQPICELGISPLGEKHRDGVVAGAQTCVRVERGRPLDTAARTPSGYWSRKPRGHQIYYHSTLRSSSEPRCSVCTGMWAYTQRRIKAVRFPHTSSFHHFARK